jgi:hypothetical protein
MRPRCMGRVAEQRQLFDYLAASTGRRGMVLGMEKGNYILTALLEKNPSLC